MRVGLLALALVPLTHATVEVLAPAVRVSVTTSGPLVPGRVSVRVVTRLVLVVVVVMGTLLLAVSPVMLGVSSTADAVMVT